jgi:uncharacterized membrane protein YgcG
MLTRQTSGLALVTGLAGLLAAAPAHADEPLAVADLITDRVGAVAGREDEVAAAQDRLFDDHRLELYVVYVDDFAGRTAADWVAEATAESRFDINQALLAVATRERAFALAVDPDYPLTGSQLAEIRNTAVAPALQQYDWAGAAIGAADGLRAVLGGEPVQAPAIVPGDPEPAAADDGFGWLPVVAVGAAVSLLIAGYLVWRWWRRRGPAPDRSEEPAGPRSDILTTDRSSSSEA